jgi:hypothetical protein
MVYSLDQITINDTTVPVYGYGLYKMSTNASNSYFYIDYRDARIPYLTIPSNHWVDHWIKYDFSNNSFYYSAISSVGPFTTISNGEYLKFWDEIQEVIPPRPSTAEFPDYWQNCLVLIPCEDNHPKLIWGPYPETIAGNINYYKIYYSYHLEWQPPGTFYLLATVESDVFDYTDITVEIGNDFNSKSYYVTALYEDEWERSWETEPTNTVTVQLARPHKRSESNYNPTQNFEYKLEQNYPNPFNPSTIIAYSIKKSGYVSLIIYDILGNKVATLVSEDKPAGNYEVEFDADGLPSGMYLYTLTSGNFVTAKKLILTK